MADVSSLDSLRIALDPVGQAGVAVALMLVMFGVALGLRVQDFRFITAAHRFRWHIIAGGLLAIGYNYFDRVNPNGIKAINVRQ